MFSSLFGSTKPTKEEERILNSPVYQSLSNEAQKKGYMKAALNEIKIYQKRNITPIIEDIKIHLKQIQNDLYVHTIKYPKKQTKETLQNPSNNQPSILMLHGYGGTSLSFYKLINLFEKQYDAYAIDYLGMGLSSHPHFDLTSVEQINEYFVESIEAWRKAKGISKLIIIGHSFGGYMGFNYSLKYSEQVEELFLVSPMGGTKRTQQEVEQFAKQRQDDGYFKQKIFNYFTEAWQEKKTISQFFKMPLVPTYILLSNYIKSRLKIEEDYRSEWYDYLTGVMDLPDSSDKAIFHLLRFPRMSAIHSIEEIIKNEINEKQTKLNFHIHFLYGDSDWMCSEGAKRIHDSQQIPCTLVQVKQASHNVVYDQPETIYSYINNSIFKTHSSNSLYSIHSKIN